LNNWIKIGGLFGFLGVALGAFGAHTFKGILTPEAAEIYRTGVLYHLIHSVVIIAIGFAQKERFSAAARFFSIGIILFSFSLYIYAITAMKIFAIITPFGGISFLIGWGLVIYTGFKKENETTN
jgi:uncharacterized membrane protein YgdD (TMEM256/DUF423 family)